MNGPDAGESAPSSSATFDVGGDPARVSKALGAAGDAILTGRATAIVLDLGRDALDPVRIGALLRWGRRNEMLLRTRTWAVVFVVPKVWHAIQWWLAVRLGPELVRATVVRTPLGASKWLAARAPKPQR